MRIALVTERFAPHVGGVELHVEQLATGLHRLGHEVDIHAAEPGRPVGTARHDGYRIRNRPSLPFVQGTRLPVGLLAQSLAEYDIIHVHNYHSLTLGALGRARSAAILTPHFHGAGRTRLLDSLHRVYGIVAARWVGRADAVICVSRHEADLFRRRFPAISDRISVIPNPLRAAIAATPIRMDSRQLLCVGRLEAYKRYDAAILALRRLPGWTLVIAGDGPDRERLEELARAHSLAARVTFAGRVSDDDLVHHLRRARCVLQLSTLEAFGMTTLEAVAAGRPVVTGGGAPAELSEFFPGWVHTARSVSPEDVAEAVELAIAAPSAAPPATARFHPRRIVADTLEVYMRALARRGASAA